MPFAENEGVQIHYEVEGRGQPIVLAHGATGNMTFWRGYGYVDQLSNDYTVILYDARAHGRSDKPHDPAAYGYRLMVQDVIAILDALSIDQVHYWGYSMGGYTGFGLAKHHPGRLHSLIVGGADPFQGPQDRHEPDELLTIFRHGAAGGVDEVVAGIKRLAGSITPQYEQRLRTLDPRAIVAYLEQAQHRPSFAGDLPQMTMPCLLYAGDGDEGPYLNGPRAAQFMPDGQFFGLRGCNHVGASATVDQVIPQVRAFLSRMA